MKEGVILIKKIKRTHCKNKHHIGVCTQNIEHIATATATAMATTPTHVLMCINEEQRVYVYSEWQMTMDHQTIEPQ